MIYFTKNKETLSIFEEKEIDCICLDNVQQAWGDEDNLKDFLKSIKKELKISYINDIVLRLPERKLTDWLKGKKYVHLGDHYDIVEKWAIERGYCPLLSYKTFY